MTIHGFWWFVVALCTFGVHGLLLWTWIRESREQLRQWDEYDAASQRRHDEAMARLRGARRTWAAVDSKRGQP